MRVAHVGLVGSAFVFAGCTTTLNSEYVGDANNPKAGAVYHLPMAMLAADFHFEILGCHVAGGEVYFTNELKNVDIRRTLVADPQQKLIIPYEKLSATTKVTDLTILYHPNGMISTITSDIEDKSSKILGNVVAGVANMALAQVPGIGTVPAESFKTSVAAARTDCDVVNQFVQRQSEIIGRLAAIREYAELEDNARKARLKELSDAREELNVRLDAEQGKNDKTEIDIIEKQIKENEAEAKTIESAPTETSKLQGELAIIRKRLTLTVSEPGWVPRPGGDNCQGVDEGPEKYMAQLKQFGLASFSSKPSADPKGRFRARACLLEIDSNKSATEKQKIPPAAGNSAAALDGKSAEKDKAPTGKDTEAKECLISKAEPSTEGSSSNASTEGFEGVLYRVPALKRIQVEDCSDGKFRKRNILTSANIISLPQLGTRALFPLKNEAFDDNELTAQFHEDGALVKFTFGARSAAESASTGFAETTGTILDFARQRDAARRAADTAAATAAASADTAELDSLDKQLQILSSLSQLQGGATSSTLNQEIVQLIQEIQLQRLRRELEDLRNQ